MTDVMDDARRIKRGILDFIHTYGCEQAPEEAFGALARDVFIYQYTYDLPYRRYCAAKRVTPATLKDWREIPPMPVDGFKHLDLSTIPTVFFEAVFMTSGTTHGGKMRGRNFHPDLEVWDESIQHCIYPAIICNTFIIIIDKAFYSCHLHSTIKRLLFNRVVATLFILIQYNSLIKLPQYYISKCF